MEFMVTVQTPEATESQLVHVTVPEPEPRSDTTVPAATVFSTSPNGPGAFIGPKLNGGVD